MKRMNKIGGVVAVTLVLAGTVLVIIALLMGATWRDANVGLVTVDGGTHHGFGLRSMLGNHPAGPALETILQEDYTGVSSLDFELEAAEVTITEGEKFFIAVSGSGSRFESKVVDGVWKIESKGVNHPQDCHYTVQITLPRGFEAQELEIDAGMGSVTADVLRGKKAELDCGMGELTVDELHSKGTKITCGMGTIRLNLTGTAEDYGYTTELGMGSIDIGDDAMTGLAGSRSFAMERENTLDITCGMGEVVVRFNQ